MPALPVVVRSLLAALLLGAAIDAAQANPEAAPADPVTTLLIERGLLKPAGTEKIVHVMRDKASDLVLAAMNFLGVPYRRGGASADDGFDCSGFTRHIFELSIGLALPRRVDEQANAPGLSQVKRDELKPGDLVFFNTLKRTFSHVGIYVGDGKFIHAPRTGARVRVEDMRDRYWAKRFTGARRAPIAADADKLPRATP
jgi:cell wall-associated NlpC family hydrolase